MCPSGSSDSSSWPIAGSCSATLLIVALIAFVTLTRARSALDAALRSRPPRPTAPASSAATNSISSRARDGTFRVVERLGLLDLLPQVLEPPAVGGLCGCVQLRSRVIAGDVKLGRGGTGARGIVAAERVAASQLDGVDLYSGSASSRPRGIGRPCCRGRVPSGGRSARPTTSPSRRRAGYRRTGRRLLRRRLVLILVLATERAPERPDPLRDALHAELPCDRVSLSQKLERRSRSPRSCAVGQHQRLVESDAQPHGAGAQARSLLARRFENAWRPRLPFATHGGEDAEEALDRPHEDRLRRA